MKSKPVPTFSWSDIDALRTRLVDDPIPAGAFTIYDYMRQYGVLIRTATSQLNRMIADGHLEKGYRHGQAMDGSRRRMAYYWRTGK